MPPVPDSYNWTQITKMGDGMADRMSREALFLVGGLPEEPGTESGEKFDYRDGLSSQTAEAVAEIEHENGLLVGSSGRSMRGEVPATWGSLLKSWSR